MIFEKVNNSPIKYVSLISCVLLCGTMLGIVHVSLIVAILAFYFFIFLNRYEKSVICIFCFCKIFGFFAPVIGLPVPGTLFALLLAVLFIREELISIFNRRLILPLFYSFLILLFLVGSYYFTGNTSYSASKIASTFISFTVYMFGFSILVSYKKINTAKLSFVFFLDSILWITFTIDTFGFFPSGLFDFNFFRETSIFLKRKFEVDISYHLVGIMSFMAISFLLSAKKTLNGIWEILFLAICFLTILISGARQALLGSVLLIIVWIIFKREKIKVSNLLLSITLLCLVYYGGQFLDIEYLDKFYEGANGSGSSLNRNYDYPMEIIKNNFWFGIGFGNYYNSSTDELYPHNIILEMLCEFGFIGTVVLLIPVLIFICSRNFHLKTKLINGSQSIILWIPFLVRAMISSDLGENIIVFISFFVLFYDKTISIDRDKKLLK